jgi:hypothetical protein
MHVLVALMHFAGVEVRAHALVACASGGGARALAAALLFGAPTLASTPTSRSCARLHQ